MANKTRFQAIFDGLIPVYASAEDQLKRALELCAWLAARSPRLHEAVFAQVIDNAKMLRTYVQILRMLEA